MSESEDKSTKTEGGSRVVESKAERDGPELPEPTSPRRETTSPGPRKHIRGKQGGLKSIMNMPFDVFTEIASCLTPGDLVALSWSNKSLRKMLLQRSASHIWRCAQSNVHGLPSCPPGMSEPQYAVLVFGKVCTICGASTRAKVDPFLHARLCSSCRDEHLIEISRWANPILIHNDLVEHSECTGVKLKSAPHPRGARPVFSLVRSVKEVLEKREMYLMDDDMSKLFDWNDARIVQVAKLRKHGEQLKSFLESVKTSREGELDDMRKQRQDTIKERLRSLGWTDRDWSEFLASDSIEWRTLVDSPKPLTARIWNNILPKLVVLLESNRARLDERDKARRRQQRRFCINDFLEEMSLAEHSLQPFVDYWKSELDHSNPVNWLYRSSSAMLGDYNLRNLFPNIGYVLTWECLADLSDREISVEEVTQELMARKVQILDGILDWNNKAENELIEKLGGSDAASMKDVQVTAVSIEQDWDLSTNQRMLLRADSVFSQDDKEQATFFLTGYSRPEDIPRYYPRLITAQYKFFSEKYANVRPFYTDIDLSGYKRNSLAEKVIKTLLDVLGTPDVTRIELQVMGPRFRCGRCIVEIPKTWDELVEHYIQASSPPCSRLKTPPRHPIPFRNVHDFDLPNAVKPLLLLLTKEHAKEMVKARLWENAKIDCLLCLATHGWTGVQYEVEGVHLHLSEVHGVSVPSEDIHYGSVSAVLDTPKWCRAWDDYCDQQLSERIQETSPHAVTEPSHTETTESGDDAMDVETDEEYRPQKKHSCSSNKTRTRRRAGGSDDKQALRKDDALKNLMNMRVDIFTEIMSYLDPGDLVALSWTNKFFRSTLLQRSASHIWRRSQKKITGLPPCPVGMSEPQYAVLMFAKICTICGAATRAQVDPFLHARLCSSCRNQNLKEVSSWNGPYRNVSHLVERSSCKGAKPSNGRGSRRVFSILPEINKVFDRRKMFKNAGDKPGLARWENLRWVLILERRRHSELLHAYLESVVTSRRNDLRGVQEQREHMIVERLKALGWTDREIPSIWSSFWKDWSTLVKVPTPLTDRIWNNILPKLTLLLEKNRAKLDEQDEKERIKKRQQCIIGYLNQINESEGALWPIFDVFKAKLAQMEPSLSEWSICLRLDDYIRSRKFLPKDSFALAWSCLADLDQQDGTLEELTAELVARKDQISQALLSWRSSIESFLASKWEDPVREAALLINDNAETASTLSLHQCLLLRADTVFMLSEKARQAKPQYKRPKYEESPYYFPSLATTQHSEYPASNKDIDVSIYDRNFKVEKIIKALLKDLGMPSVTRIELQVFGSHFLCGRCIDKEPKGWDELASILFIYTSSLIIMLSLSLEQVEHYIEVSHATPTPPRIKIILLIQIPYRNVHDLDSTINPNPLAWRVTKENVCKMEKAILDGKDGVSCFLCAGSGWAGRLLEIEDMCDHIDDAHGIVDPVEGLHYGQLDDGVLGLAWYQKWHALQSGD
ncbi:valine-tRNA ligase [Ceratobasidium sp. AG-Ba]|nr:valine-tRNA ligase [Ceratobasidium sp. AG-Ba]QRV98741.1 valine-tRNA ligase [Ceratobasidium sp. AG-Ba]